MSKGSTHTVAEWWKCPKCRSLRSRKTGLYWPAICVGTFTQRHRRLVCFLRAEVLSDNRVLRINCRNGVKSGWLDEVPAMVMP